MNIQPENTHITIPHGNIAVHQTIIFLFSDFFHFCLVQKAIKVLPFWISTLQHPLYWEWGVLFVLHRVFNYKLNTYTSAKFIRTTHCNECRKIKHPWMPFACMDQLVVRFLHQWLSHSFLHIFHLHAHFYA